MTNLEKIRAACIKANPEIVDLKFGARVKLLDYKDFPDAWGLYASKRFDAHAQRKIDMVMHPNGELFAMDEKFEVVGRPIRLADVLLTLAMEKKDLICDGSRQFPGMINIFPSPKAKPGTIPEPTYCRWNGSTDDLSLQSENTINFIASIL